MLVSVLLREKQFFVSVGPATQPASWLAHVACLRYDTTLGQHIGPPVALRRADGQLLTDWTQPVSRCVVDGEQLVVVLRTDQQQQQAGRHNDDRYELVRPIKDDTQQQRHDDDDGSDEDEGEDGWDEQTATTVDGTSNAATRYESSDSDDEVDVD